LSCAEAAADPVALQDHYQLKTITSSRPLPAQDHYQLKTITSSRPLPAQDHYQWPCKTITSSATTASSSNRLFIAAPELTSVHRLTQLTLHCSASCDLTDTLQHAAPAELVPVTVPSLIDVLPALDWPLDLAAASPGPAKFRVNFPAAACSSLESMCIDTSRTRAGMIIEDKLMISISSSRPNLQWLKLKGVLRFSSSGAEAMRSGLSKLQVLRLHDAQRQAVQQLARLAAATGAAAEPAQESELRLQQLHAAEEDLEVLCCLLLASSMSFSRVRHRVARWLAAVVSSMTLAAAPLAVCEVLMHAVWTRQQQVAKQLYDSACGLRQLPRVICCWLPPQLELLQLAGCFLDCHKSRCCQCSAFDADDSPKSATHWFSVDTVSVHGNGSGNITLVKQPENRNYTSYSSRSSRRAVLRHHSSLADAAAAAGIAAQLPVQQVLQEAAQPCMQLQRRLRGSRLRLLRVIVWPLICGMAGGGTVGLVLGWCVKR
jgi:hypothetical protein